MRSTLVAVLMMVMFMAGLVAGQSAPPAKPKYSPTEVQSLRLQLAQQKAINAQQQMQTACGNGITPGTYAVQFQTALAQLNAEADTVKKAQNWPDAVTFDDTTLAYSDPPAAPSAAAKSDDKKPEPRK